MKRPNPEFPAFDRLLVLRGEKGRYVDPPDPPKSEKQGKAFGEFRRKLARRKDSQ